MDDNQRQRLLWLYPEAGGRVFRLGHYSDIDVPDPHKQDLVAFRSALDAIERGIAEWLPRLKNI
jgi:protein-tyrosine phosphatase